MTVQLLLLHMVVHGHSHDEVVVRNLVRMVRSHGPGGAGVVETGMVARRQRRWLRRSRGRGRHDAPVLRRRRQWRWSTVPRRRRMVRRIRVASLLLLLLLQ